MSTDTIGKNKVVAVTEEKHLPNCSGWIGLLLTGLLLGYLLHLIYVNGGLVLSFLGGPTSSRAPFPTWGAVYTVVLCIVWLRCLCGFFTLQPNMSYVSTFLGHYVGTERRVGFRYTVPLFSGRKISLRVNNHETEKIKVNDKAGNPVVVSAVVVWAVESTSRAVFDVGDYGEYIVAQSDAALRQVVGSHPYDVAESEDGQEETSLRGDTETVSKELEQALTERFERAGVCVIEARLNHLAYAPEIAEAMLRRQQAQAIIDARKKIVKGAVGMVEDAIGQLKEKDLDVGDERSRMISNLLVVLSGDHGARPILNVGS